MNKTNANKFKFGTTIGDLKRTVELIDTVIHDKWNRNVPIIPGKPVKKD